MQLKMLTSNKEYVSTHTRLRPNLFADLSPKRIALALAKTKDLIPNCSTKAQIRSRLLLHKAPPAAATPGLPLLAPSVLILTHEKSKGQLLHRLLDAKFLNN